MTLLQSCLLNLKEQVKSDSYSSSGVESEDDKLLHFLKEVFSLDHDDSFKDNLKNIISTQSKSMKNDRLFSWLLGPKYLKPCLDLVMENTPTAISKGLKIAESSPQHSHMIHHVMSQLGTQPMLKIDYHAVCSQWDEETVADLETLGAVPEVWDGQNELLKTIAKIDLAIYNMDHSVRIAELSTQVSHMCTAVKDGGFLLIHYPKAYVDVLSIINSISDADKYQEAFTKDEIMKVIKELGSFNLIAEKSSGTAGYLFLFRKYLEKKHKVRSLINVADVSYKWVDEVKFHMGNSHYDLVLMSSGTELSGVVGMVNCLRAEPGGENIR
jgi:fatty acid synthase